MSTGDQRHTHRRGTRRTIAAVATLAVLGGAVAVAYPFGWRSAGQQVDVLKLVPADVDAAITLDADPGMMQQAELVRFAMKVPSLERATGFTLQGDVKRQLWQKVVGRTDCRSVNYDKDVKPWLGDRATMALREKSQPVVVLQVADESDKAVAGARKMASCFGWGSAAAELRQGNVVMAPTRSGLDAALAAAQTGALTDKPEFVEDWARVGSKGAVSFWLDRDGIAMARGLAQARYGTKAQLPLSLLKSASLRSAAGTVRFVDGNPLLRVVAKNTHDLKTTTRHTRIEGLPGTTSLAFGMADGAPTYSDHQTWIAKWLAARGTPLALIAKKNHLSLPADAQATLGKDLRFARGPVPKGAKSLDQVPWAWVGTTEQAGVDQLLKRATPVTQGWQRSAGREQGDVVVARNKAWGAQQAAAVPTLDDQPEFQAAFYRAEQAQVGFYANLVDLQPIWGPTLTPTQLADYKAIAAVGVAGHNEDANYSVLTASVATR